MIFMSTAALKFKIFDAKGTHVVPMAKSTATVGSASHCDVVLNHATVQPEHARAWCEGGRIWVQDLGTPAGTTLNGIRLPPLKPMLVRELDIVKLGDCPATMGIEPNVVRAPAVKPQSSLPEFTATDMRPLVSPDASPEKKNEDLERMHRELADLKLQVQMATLEKDSGEDLRVELKKAKDDVVRLRAEREKLKESFTHFDGDKKNFKLQLENEVAELKLKGLRDLKEQREEDTRKFEKWKSETAVQLASNIRMVAEQRLKVWNQRPFTKEMMQELDAEQSTLIRRVILGVTHTSTNVPVPPAVSSVKIPVVPGTPQVERRKKPRPSSKGGDGPWQKIAVGGFVLALFMAVAFFASTYMKSGGTRSMASQMETAPPQAPAAMAAKVPQAGNDKRTVTAAEPAKSAGFKKSYTDNVLSTINYVDAELNMDFRTLWIKELNRAALKEWKLDAKAVNEIATKEFVLIQDLSRLKGTPAQMRQRETQFMTELQTQLGKKATADKFMRLKRAFYSRNQVYLTREVR